MARITSPGDLNQVVGGIGEVIFDTVNFTIEIVTDATVGITASAVDEGGVTLQALYSFAKIEWKDDPSLIRFPFPFIAITGEQFELINGWDFEDDFTRNLIRDAGWALRNTSGVIVEEFMNITSLGLFNDSATDVAYYLQEEGGVPTPVVLPGEVNQAIKIFGGPLNGDFNFKTFFNIYLREQGKTYGFYDLIAEQNIPSLTFRKYALPLVNAIDLKIVESDLTISTTAPYTGMDITYFASPQSRTIGASSYNFNIIIDGNNGTAEQIYEFVQWSLRQTTDIDAGGGVRRGDTSQELLQFIGDTLRTRLTEDGGVFIDNFQPADTNRLEFTDNLGLIRTFPFVAAGNIIFNDNLQNDIAAKYFVFYTNDDAGANAGSDFGTANAILIEDNSGDPLTSTVSGLPFVAFDYDYDGNDQRGVGSEGTDAPFTAVALGLITAQYVVTTGTIVRSTANVINFVAALERNFIA
jgi:hypothetical protein